MKIFASDFETTTDDPNEVAVWSAESIEINKDIEPVSDNCIHQTNISDFIDFVSRETLLDNTRYYFHNLKFDGSYILDYLEKSSDWKAYADTTGALKDKTPGIKQKEYEKAMPNKSYSYMVSDKNVMYSITLKIGENTCQFRDSMKLIPFKLKDIAKSFGTKHKKLEMDYGNKNPGYEPTPDEMAYIENDVLVLKEAIEIAADLLEAPIEKLPLTIGSVSLNYFKRTIDENFYKGYNFKKYFPSQVVPINKDTTQTFDDYVRKSYHGGWCYAKPDTMNEVIQEHGFVYDVNSLYPSVMHSSSGCFYPIGKGHIRSGAPDESEINAYKHKRIYYFIRFRCEFKLKEKHLPTVQIKGNPLYDGTIWLATSDIYDKYKKEWISNRPVMTMTCTDFELFKEHYDIKNLEVYDHVNYRTKEGLFDKFIDHWYDIKKHSKGALRTWAKLILNNCYGKFSTAPVGDYIFYQVKDDEVLHSEVVDVDDPNRAVYIPVGSAITSWARNFTIRHAQKNYDIFCYADTDSIHCKGYKTDAIGIEESPTELCCWKNEIDWDKAIFAGQKRYIEHTVAEDGEPCENYNNIKCCGMGAKAKENLDKMFKDGKDYDIFKPGLVVPGNLKSRRVKGGIRLTEQDFTFHNNHFMMQ